MYQSRTILALALANSVSALLLPANPGRVAKVHMAATKPLPSPTGQKKLGLLRLEGWGNPETTGTGVVGYVPIPGDIDAKDSYDFDFIGAVAEGCKFEVLCEPTSFDDPEQRQELLLGVKNATKRLVVRGAEAIIGNCGLFMWLHATGLIEQAVDEAMEDLGDDYARPYVMLSSLTTLAYDTGLASCHTFGEGQEKALVTLLAGLEVETTSKVTTRKCKVVVFTSNGDSCKELLNAIPQLKGLKVFFDGEMEGDVLVVGLNGRVNGKKVPVIGLEGVSENGQVGGESVNGFKAVATGLSVFYDIVNPDIMLVAKAVKEKYPTVRMACVECTEVSAYSDTIREAMRVPVHDPINTAYGMLHALQPTGIDRTRLRKPVLGVLRLERCNDREVPTHPLYMPYTGYIDAENSTSTPRTVTSFCPYYSHDFDFLGEEAEGCTFGALCDPARFKDPEQIKELLPGVQTAIKKLVERGARAIIGNDGLFMWLHPTGLIEHAVDNVMTELGPTYIRPHVMLSSLTTLGSSLATLGVGEGQEKARGWNPASEVTAPKCKAVVFTFDGDSCKALLKALPQLQGLTVFFDGETEGDVLVVGLNGEVNGEKVPVIGLEGVSENPYGQVGGGRVNGFDAVATDGRVLYDIVQPDIMRVAKAVKKKYKEVRIAYIECPEVSAYSDTIKEAMRVPVHDPIKGAYGMMNAVNDHNFRQLGNKARIAQMASTLDMTPVQLVLLGDLDEQLLEVGASNDPLHEERQRARALAVNYNHNFRQLGNKERIAQVALALDMTPAELVKNKIIDAQLLEVGTSDDPLHD